MGVPRFPLPEVIGFRLQTLTHFDRIASHDDLKVAVFFHGDTENRHEWVGTSSPSA